MTRKKLTHYGANTLRGDDEIMVAGFDTETAGLGGNLLSIQYGVMGKIIYDTGPEMLKTFFDFICQWPSPVVWYAHNAQYEWRYMMNWLADSGYEIEINMRTDSDVYQIVIILENGKKIIMRDSYALWNSSLADLAKAFCPELPKLEIDIANFDPVKPQHIEYAKRDVEILLLALPRLFIMLNKHFKVNPNGTFASTALKAWQKGLPDKQIYNSMEWSDTEKYIRQAYYGGLVFLTTIETQENCETFDINSSYPDAMCRWGVPYGRCMASKNYHDEKMGIYHCRVRAPKNLIVPIIPARNTKGNMRWYGGEFDTTCTNRELVFAANHGYEILEIYSGLIWEETIFPFNDIIGLCKDIRKRFPGMSEEKLAKYMQNSLYGKYGSRRERMKVFQYATASREDFKDAYAIDEDGKWWVRMDFDDEMRAMPHWAVFITAHARLKLLKAVYTIGPENVYYGDTDSITIDAKYSHLMDSGSDYGQWKLEKEWQHFRAIAPKVYSGKLQDGTYKGAAKGLPRRNLKQENWIELLETGQSTAQALSLSSLRVSMKKGNLPAKELIRKSSNLNNSTNFQLLPNGKVRVKIAA